MADLFQNPLAMIMLAERVSDLLRSLAPDILDARLLLVCSALLAVAAAAAWWWRDWRSGLGGAQRDIYDDEELIQAVLENCWPRDGSVPAPAHADVKSSWRWTPGTAGGPQVPEINVSKWQVPRNQTVRSPSPGGDIRITYDLEETQHPVGSSKTAVSTVRKDHVRLTCSGADAARRLDEFVDRCVESHNAKVRAERSSDKRCVWLPKVVKSSEGERGLVIAYSDYEARGGYRLTSDICPRQDEVCRHMDAMMRADCDDDDAPAAAVPAKRTMGMTLSGPPGTGKTTCVKALAEKYGLHVIVLKLSLYLSDPDGLRRLLFSGEFFCTDEDGETKPTSLKVGTYMLLVDECDCDRGGLMLRRDDVDVDVAPDPDPEPRFEQADQVEDWMVRKANRLDLGALLEMLDGIVDARFRVIVAVTNRPDRIDPALLRPGRLGDFVIELGPLPAHRVEAAFRERYGVVPPIPLLPAPLAAMCATFAACPDALEAARRLVGDRIAKDRIADHHHHSVDDDSARSSSSVEGPSRRSAKTKNTKSKAKAPRRVWMV